jgi:hypothetical protein
MATGKGRRRAGDRTSDRSEALFGLIDVETGNMVGSFPSERAALLAVAATAREYGAESEAVLSLALFREDAPPEEGGIADGAELVRRALAAAQAVGAPAEHLPT